MEKKNLNITLIKELLYLEVKDYNEKLNKKKELQSNASMLEEMINILSSEDYENMQENYIFFDSIIPMFFNNQEASKNILNSLYKHITYCKNYTDNQEKYLKEDYEKGKKYIRSLLNKLNTILEQTNAEIIFTFPNISEEKMNKYKEITHSLKFNKELSAHDYNILIELFKRKELDDKSIILLLERVKNHNISTHFTNKQELNYNKLNEISNIIMTGFEKFEDIDWIEDTRKKQLDSLIETILRQGITIKDNKVDDEIAKEILPKYKGELTFSDNYTLNNIKYIYINILKYYQEDLLQANQDLSVLDNYRDESTRKLALQSYRETLLKYKYIRNKFDNEINKYNQDLEKVSEEEDVRKLHFGVKESGITFIESDLKNIPKDTYSSVKELLMLFKKDKLKPSQTKQLNEAYPGNLEIKDDQIRIIYRHIKDNEFIIIGIFIKKDNNPKYLYQTYCSRKPISIVNSNNVEEEIFTKLTPHSGGRRNT